ncbi:MAG: purine permease [Candidatus Dormibacteraeota bacterium]|nr:purine permease [Candidatus Dormibacteraeota bacterium]
MNVSGSATTGAKTEPAVHPVDEVLRVDRLGVLGLQHVLIMYAGTVAVPLIIGAALKLPRDQIALLVSADLFTCGICSVIQAFGIANIMGVKLPVVAGATFTAVTPMILIGSQYGLRTMYGAVIVSGVFGLLVAKPFSSILRFFPPLVTGTVIAVIGLSLVGAGAGLIAGNDPTAKDYGAPVNIALAGLVILIILAISRFVRGFWNQVAVLGGLVLGTIVAAILGKVDFSSVGHVGWFGLTTPFRFGSPQFNLTAVISMCIVILVTYTESTADMLAVAEIVGKKLSPNDLARGLATDGFSAVLGGVFNSFPDTAYAENVGLVSLTGVRSRFVVVAAGVILVALGLFPKLGEIIASLPGPVVGGAALVMFAMVTAVGIRTLAKVNYEGNHNLLIVAVALGVGLLPTVAPSIYSKFPNFLQIIFGSSITSTVIVVFALNLFFNHMLGGTHADEAVEVALEEGAVAPNTPSGPELPH